MATSVNVVALWIHLCHAVLREGNLTYINSNLNLVLLYDICTYCTRHHEQRQCDSSTIKCQLLLFYLFICYYF